MIDAADIRPSLYSALVFVLMWLTLVPLVRFLAAKYDSIVPGPIQALIGMS